MKVEADKEYNIEGFDESKVADIDIVGYGHDVTHALILFLMEDGTVYWLDAYDSFDNNNFNAEKIPNVTNVIKIVGGSLHHNEGGGGRTVFGIRNDGTFYDLTFETVNK